MCRPCSNHYLFSCQRTSLQLAAHCNDLIRDRFGSAELLVPHDRYDVIARLRQVGHVQEEEPLDEGVRLIGRFPPSQNGYFAPFVISD